jgi:hypothetical protein
VWHRPDDDWHPEGTAAGAADVAGVVMTGVEAPAMIPSVAAARSCTRTEREDNALTSSATAEEAPPPAGGMGEVVEWARNAALLAG